MQLHTGNFYFNHGDVVTWSHCFDCRCHADWVVALILFAGVDRTGVLAFWLSRQPIWNGTVNLDFTKLEPWVVEPSTPAAWLHRCVFCRRTDSQILRFQVPPSNVRCVKSIQFPAPSCCSHFLQLCELSLSRQAWTQFVPQMGCLGFLLLQKLGKDSLQATWDYKAWQCGSACCATAMTFPVVLLLHDGLELVSA